MGSCFCPKLSLSLSLSVLSLYVSLPLSKSLLPFLSFILPLLFLTILLLAPPSHPHSLTHSLPPSLVQRAYADPQHRVVRQAEDLGAALRLHGRGPERPGGDRPRRLRLRQQDGPQAQRADHGRQGDRLCSSPPVWDGLMLLFCSQPVCQLGFHCL